MASPIDPEMCLVTGRLLTEWFEYAEYTDAQLRQMAMDHVGTDEYIENEPFGHGIKDAKRTHIQHQLQQFKAARKSRKWRNGMSMQEVHWRLNEATKMITPDNFKFLDDDVRKRTGLEVNPLWMMECLVRSGVLSPKEQVAALTNLAQYTHSKAATVNLNNNTNMKPEDWLLELAKEEYKEIEFVEPHQPRERGQGKTHAWEMKRRLENKTAVVNYRDAELEALKAEVGDMDVDGE